MNTWIPPKKTNSHGSSQQVITHRDVLFHKELLAVCLLPASLYCYHLSYKPVLRYFFLTVSKQLEGNGGYGYLTAGLVNRSPAQQRGEQFQTGVNLLQSYLNWTIYRVLGKTSPLRGNSDFKVNSPWFVCLFLVKKTQMNKTPDPKQTKKTPNPNTWVVDTEDSYVAREALETKKLVDIHFSTEKFFTSYIIS